MTEKEQLQAEMQKIKDRLREIDHASRSTLGKNLLRCRTSKNLTQLELAEAVGCTRVTITNIERGTCDTTLSRLLKFCGVLNVTPNDLLLEIQITALRLTGRGKR